MTDPINIDEDEEPEGGLTVLEFLKKNKQLVWMAVAFVLAYTFFSFIARQMDAAVAAQDADSALAHQKANPWAKER